jgi:hypothetical protein
MAAPIGEWFFGLQLAHFSHYIFCFFVGILAYRGEWFSKLQRPQARRWGIVALVTIPFFFVLLILGGVLEGEEQLAKFMGGFYWQSFALSVWESILLFAISFSALFLPGRVNMRTPLSAVGYQRVPSASSADHRDLVDTWFIRSTYTCSSSSLRIVDIRPLCFAYLILKIPGVKRVVG